MVDAVSGHCPKLHYIGCVLNRVLCPKTCYALEYDRMPALVWRTLQEQKFRIEYSVHPMQTISTDAFISKGWTIAKVAHEYWLSKSDTQTSRMPHPVGVNLSQLNFAKSTVAVYEGEPGHT